AGAGCEVDAGGREEGDGAVDLADGPAINKRIVKLLGLDVAVVHRSDEGFPRRPRADRAAEFGPRLPRIRLVAIERRRDVVRRRARPARYEGRVIALGAGG